MTDAKDKRRQVLEAIRDLDAPPLVLSIFERSGRVPLGARTAVAARLTASDRAVVQVRPNGAAVELTWVEFHERITSTSRWLRARGVAHGGRVMVCLPNGIAHVIATHAAWRLGATVIPVDLAMTQDAKRAILRELDPVVIVDDTSCQDLLLATQATDFPDAFFGLPDPYAILPTGGTGGLPRLVTQSGTLWGRFDAVPTRLSDLYGIRFGQVQLVCAPLSHGFGFGYAHAFGLAYGHRLILAPHFDADVALQLIERYGVQYMAFVPTMMKRIAGSPRFAASDLRSLEAVLHAAAPCPAAVKRQWIERIGPERIYEAYGATDVSLTCAIRGDEWLRKPGSIGRPLGADILIVDSEGQELEMGCTGDIWVRPHGASHHPEVLGQRNSLDQTGFRPIGDRGHVDASGYLYLEGRSDAAINVGGILVQPEAVESILMAHPHVRDAAVIGIPDSDLGERVEAIVELAPGSEETAPGDILAWCAERCSGAERPRSVHIMDRLPRSSVGKLLRADLAAGPGFARPTICDRSEFHR